MSSTPTVKKETITPSKARKWLKESNAGNRNARKQVVDMYARDIASGQWAFTGDAIRFNGDGSLIDGQHRLMAVVAANHPIEALVIRGLDSVAKLSIDSGVKRTLADVLHYQGYINTSLLAATIRWCVNYERRVLTGSTGGHNVVSVAEALRWLDENPEVVDYVSMNHTGRTRYHSMRLALIAIQHYNRNTNPADAAAFVEQACSGIGLTEGSPVTLLRRWLEWSYSHTKRLRSARDTQAITIKAWNAFIEGRSPRALSFKPGGARGESFPVIQTGGQG